MSSSNPLPCKVVFVGDAGVGKTCIIKSALGRVFNSATPPTVGTGFEKLPITRNSRDIVFEIWDTAGQERYQALTTYFFKGANAAVLVMDLTRPDTMDPLSVYLRKLYDSCSASGLVLILVGNKQDLETQRQITPAHITDLQQTLKIQYYIECSALTGKNVLDIFHTLADCPDLTFAQLNPGITELVRVKSDESTCSC
jgi:small GTP-binding protein